MASLRENEYEVCDSRRLEAVKYKMADAKMLIIKIMAPIARKMKGIFANISFSSMKWSKL